MPDRDSHRVLSDRSAEILHPDKPVVIDVDEVSLDYNSANQKLNSLKEFFVAAMKRQLMFKSFRAVDHVSLKVQSGDVYGILGTNGSGKSTLLKTISGVLEPTEGSITIKGSIAPLIEMGAGFDYELTARENIYLNGSLLGYSKSFIDQHFDAIVEFAEIGDFLDLPLKNYSSGMVSRIAFAIATVIVPDILIVDEVLSVGDQMFRKKCEKRIQALIREYGTTVLIVSHSSAQIERMCNKAIWIDKGHMRMVGEAKEVSRAYQALGGHSGSSEAEGYLCSLLDQEYDDAMNIVQQLSGRNELVVNDLLNRLLVGKTSDLDCAVVVDSDDPAMFLAGLSVAARSNGLIVCLDLGELTAKSVAYLASLRPSRVIILDSGNVKDSTVKELRQVCDLSAIDVIEGKDPAEISRSYMRQLPIVEEADGVAVLAMSHIVAAAATLSAYIYRHQLPVIVADGSEASIQDVIDLLANKGFSDVICLYEDERAFEVARRHVETRGMNAIGFADTVTDEANEAVVSWILEQDDPVKSVYVTALDEPAHAIAAAPLAGYEEAFILGVDHVSMDSMQRVLDAPSRCSGPIRLIRLIGSDGYFDPVDNELFTKSAIMPPDKH